MMGWIIAIIMVILACAGTIILARLPTRMWVMPASIGALALAGYAYQGRPDVPASYAKPIVASSGSAEQLIAIRQEMDQNFGAAKRYLILSDGPAKDGNYALAAAFVKNGLNKYPNNHELWGALGLQLMLASDGRISPPAQLAFDRSRKAWPKGPVPDYFEGLAALFEGRAADTQKYWERALVNATPKAQYRPILERQLAALKQLQERASPPDEQ